MVINTKEEEKPSLAAQPLQVGAQPIAPQQQNQQQQEDQALGTGPSSYTQPSQAGSVEAPRTETQPKSVGTGHSSLKRFMGANVGASGRMMGEIGQQAGQKSADIRQNMQQQQTDLMNRISGNRARLNEAYQNIIGQEPSYQQWYQQTYPSTPQPQDQTNQLQKEYQQFITDRSDPLVTQKIMQMEGGDKLSGLGFSADQIKQIQNLYQDTQIGGDKVDFTEGLGYNPQAMARIGRDMEALSKFGQFGQEDRRKEVLRQVFGRGTNAYGRGLSQLDAMLLGQGTPQEQQRAFIDRLRSISDTTGQEARTAQQESRREISQVKGRERLLESQLKKALEETYGVKQVDDPETEIDESQFYDTGIGGELDRRIREQDTPYFHALNKLKAGEELTEADIAVLGEDLSGQRSYGTDILYDMLGAEETRASAATGEDLARLDALAQLRRMNQDILVDPSLVGEKSQSITDALYNAQIEKQEAVDKANSYMNQQDNVHYHYKQRTGPNSAGGDTHQDSYKYNNALHHVGLGPWRGSGHNEWGMDTIGHKSLTDSFYNRYNELAATGYYDTMSGGFDTEAYVNDMTAGVNKANRYRGYNPDGSFATDPVINQFGEKQPLVPVPEGESMTDLRASLSPEERGLTDEELVEQGILTADQVQIGNQIDQANYSNSFAIQKHKELFGDFIDPNAVIGDFSEAQIKFDQDSEGAV